MKRMSPRQWFLNREGIAEALTFADIEHDGRSFAGVDDDGALELVS